MNQIFQMKYSSSLQIKRLQKNQISKLEVEKIYQISWALGASFQNLSESAISYRPPTLTFDFLQPLGLQEHALSHLKDVVHICLETESQDHGMTFNVIYVCSNYTYFISYRLNGFCNFLALNLNFFFPLSRNVYLYQYPKLPLGKKKFPLCSQHKHVVWNSNTMYNNSQQQI